MFFQDWGNPTGPLNTHSHELVEPKWWESGADSTSLGLFPRFQLILLSVDPLPYGPYGSTATL